MTQTAAAGGRPGTITFHSRPQPSFNKNFDLLIRTLHEWKTAGYEIYICSENTKQFDRLSSIFKELKETQKFIAVNAIHFDCGIITLVYKPL